MAKIDFKRISIHKFHITPQELKEAGKAIRRIDARIKKKRVKICVQQ